MCPTWVQKPQVLPDVHISKQLESEEEYSHLDSTRRLQACKAACQPVHKTPPTQDYSADLLCFAYLCLYYYTQLDLMRTQETLKFLGWNLQMCNRLDSEN